MPTTDTDFQIIDHRVRFNWTREIKFLTELGYQVSPQQAEWLRQRMLPDRKRAITHRRRR